MCEQLEDDLEIYDAETNEWRLKTQEEMSNNKLNSRVKEEVEVSAIEVHKILHFLLFGNAKCKFVIYCGNCKMPNFLSSSYTTSVTCMTCHTYHNKYPKGVYKTDTLGYQKIIRNLPLKNFGKMFMNQAERIAKANHPSRTYNDLTHKEREAYDDFLNLTT